ncbi:MAG: D-arabinono-1,4-lactone oxidase, partial [Pseudomonadota bacterium]|nr:D-arabinono-1,4-lactone oxidase [Pseudomonadota bacterium]
CMPANVTALKLVTASGELLECSPAKNSDVFEAARVNLGALGIVTEVTMQNQPKYTLKRETTWLPIEEILENAETIADNNRNYEFYYIPFSGMGFNDIHNITNEPASSTEKIDQNDGAETLKQVRDWLSWSPKVRELILGTYMSSLEKEVTIANSWENYASERNVRFNEMEYHLPRENAFKAFREIKDTVEKNFPEVFFPFEFRFVKSDDIWMSPFYGRETCSIAVHRYFEEDYQPLFKAIEPIFKKYHGRPHWGKLNTLNTTELAALYPHWNDFQDVRREMDPEGKFLNPYLKKIFA